MGLRRIAGIFTYKVTTNTCDTRDTWRILDAPIGRLYMRHKTVESVNSHEIKISAGKAKNSSFNILNWKPIFRLKKKFKTFLKKTLTFFEKTLTFFEKG